MSVAVMGKNRLEAFNDGVIAILITIMVLELKVPHGDDLATLRLLIYVLVALMWLAPDRRIEHVLGRDGTDRDL